MPETRFRCVRGEGDAASRAELLMYDYIGFDPWSGSGVTARAVVDALAGLEGVTEVDVRINSPGGDVSDGVAIYNALARFNGRVVVHVDGIAASIATLIAMAGDEIRSAENAMWMVHQPWTIAVGDAPEMRRTAEILDRYWTGMLATYARRTGRRAETITSRVEKAGGEWWMTSAEALEAGFADVVSKPDRDVEAYGLARYRQVPERLAAAASAAPGPVAGREVPRLVEVSAPRVTRPPNGPSLVEARARRLRMVEAVKASI